ncbi:hypothetical protein EIN_095770 [Entamoeba invadens IP1]|uniref:C2 domain-containing protein n=1 Tax=Entamoeba invadens IP1 TaxID=370355 RepID=A0A0A1U0A5_ENTIV|nr:hypothetical protein EIN_095770 [Entamoeba invadens IP1]ELP87320.1 hypothetical protein EIN_095770 [Entamoeba invadens IP1]|eukprot:XP_004254091.1 hypothetical protein EIN_095770 [Entamoeba invadens IP1]
MKLSAVITKSGRFNEAVIGYVVLETPSPITLSYGFLEISMRCTTLKTIKEKNSFKFTYLASTGIVPPDYLLRDMTDINAKTIDIIELIGAKSRLEKEYPPGIYTFPFSFKVPLDTPPSSLYHEDLPKIDFSYGVTPFFVDKKKYWKGNVTLFPVVFSSPVIEKVLFTKVQNTFVMGESVVTLLLPKKEFFIGEDIDFHLKIESRSPHENQDYIVSLIQMYNTYFLFNRNVIQTIEISGAQRISETKIVFHQDITLPPSLNRIDINVTYFIAIEMVPNTKEKKNTHIETLYTINILANVPDEAQIEDHQKKSSIRFVDEKFYFPDPPQNFLCCDCGLEKVMIDGNKEVLLDHINRVVLDTTKQNVDMRYPLLESETLPSGCVFGVYRGQRYIVDYINKKANWDLEEESLEVTQAASSDCASPILTIEVVESVGLCVKDSETPSTVYCAVINESGKLVKSKEVKNVDQIYENARFVIPLNPKRKDVVVYFYHKRFLISDVFLGCVEFDLTHLKFGSNIETWFYLKGGDDGNSIVSGKALIRVCYDSKEKKDGWDVVGELFRENFDYSLAHNREMEKAIKAQNALRQKLFAPPIYEKRGEEYFPVNYDY